MEKMIEQVNVRLKQDVLTLIDEEIKNSNGIYISRSHYLRCCAIVCSKNGLQKVISSVRKTGDMYGNKRN